MKEAFFTEGNDEYIMIGMDHTILQLGDKTKFSILIHDADDKFLPGTDTMLGKNLMEKMTMISIGSFSLFDVQSKVNTKTVNVYFSAQYIFVFEENKADP